MGFLVLGLLGTALLGAIAFDWFDDDDTTQSDEPQSEDEIGQELNFDGSETLEGTEGDDTLPAGQDGRVAPETINLLGGNDTANVEYEDIITVTGGDGDDSISATGVLNTLDGGAGNDTLTADDSNRLLGGAGNDVLNFNHGSYDQGEPGSADGGEGDDTITVRADALVPDFIRFDVGGVDVSGGSGADEFNIVYQLAANFDGGVGLTIGSGEDTNFAGNFVGITDFDPNEDSLVIELERDSDTIDRDVEVELIQTEENGSYRSVIILTFLETDDAKEATNALTVFSTSPFTLDDIQLIGV
jgi:Ca2+-binding RTX toxin-like protein